MRNWWRSLDNADRVFVMLVGPVLVSAALVLTLALLRVSLYILFGA